MLSPSLPVMRRERMSTVDTAWLRMDSPGNLMMIVSVLMFDKPLDIARFKHTMVSRFLPYSRFRSRVVQDITGAWWHEQEIDLDDHIIHTRLGPAKPDNKAELEALVGNLSATPLDPSKPLWQMHLVDNCVGEDGKKRQAVIIRIHHCIADGVALVGVLLSMFDTSAKGDDRAPMSDGFSAPTLKQTDPLEENPWMQLMLPVTKTTITAINVSTTMMTKYMAMMADSNKLLARLSGMGQMTSKLTQDAVKLMEEETVSQNRPRIGPAGWSAPWRQHEDTCDRRRWLYRQPHLQTSGARGVRARGVRQSLHRISRSGVVRSVRARRYSRWRAARRCHDAASARGDRAFRGVGLCRGFRTRPGRLLPE